MKSAPKQKGRRQRLSLQSLGRAILALLCIPLVAGAGTADRSSAKSSFPTIIAALIWLGVTVTATLLMVAYANAPGQSGLPPMNWPKSSQVPRDTDRPTLVMFVHPHCPCSKASISELALLMTYCQEHINAHVVFLKPANTAQDWMLTSSWREAAAIPYVTVHCDEAGREAQLFLAETSGDTVLYDAKGNLLFHGGITISRGHSGDNPGRSALQTLVLDQSAQQTQTPVLQTPVFGCSLFEAECQKGSVECKQ
ncbi:MAG TPA: RedB protein [Verrucomicrobiae bacterium]|nr:RedB protein [Verrucomicrobiae bacterium]